MAWTGQHCNISLWDFFLYLLGKSHKCIFLYSLCHIYNNLSFLHIRLHIARRASSKRRRYCQHKEILTHNRLFHIAGENHFLRKLNPRKLTGVFPFGRKHINLFLINRPNGHLMSVLVKQKGKGCSPASRSHHAYVCHSFHVPFSGVSQSPSRFAIIYDFFFQHLACSLCHVTAA